MKKYFDILEELAKDMTPAAGSRIVSCLIYKKKIISFGFNQLKSHPFQKKYAKNKDAIYLHSETDCIRNALRTLTLDEVAKSTLLILRVKKDQDDHTKWVLGNCKPCCGCMRAIVEYDIKNVHFTTDGGYDKL